jgi:hypothetical protein
MIYNGPVVYRATLPLPCTNVCGALILMYASRRYFGFVNLWIQTKILDMDSCRGVGLRNCNSCLRGGYCILPGHNV